MFFQTLLHVKAKKAFSKILKELRLAQDLSQEKLAEKAGLSMRSISLIECEKIQPTITTIEGLSHALGMKMSDIMIAVEKHLK